MNGTKTTLERSFELAQSGVYVDVTGIRKRLKAEGYDNSQVYGHALIRQLKAIIAKARANAHRS